MVFKLVYGNHPFAHSIHDTMQLIQYGMSDIGHQVDFEKNITRGKVNIIIENFNYDFLQRYLDASKYPGTSFILIGTEYVTGNTFNSFEKKSDDDLIFDSHYSNDEYWKKRFITFFEASEIATSIWHLNEHAVSDFQDKIPKDKVHYLPHCFLDGLYRKPTFKNNKDIDILFTGTLTSFRKKFLKSLASDDINVKFLPTDTPPHIRQSFARRSKISLNLKQYTDWQYPSNSRYHFHLMNNTYLVSHKFDYDCDLSQFIDEICDDDLLEYCKTTLETRDYHIKEKNQTEKYHQEKINFRYFEKILDFSL